MFSCRSITSKLLSCHNMTAGTTGLLFKFILIQV